MSVLFLPSSHAQGLELAAILFDQIKWRTLLDQLTFVHHEDLAAWHDCLGSIRQSGYFLLVYAETYSETMGDDEYSHTFELFMD